MVSIRSESSGTHSHSWMHIPGSIHIFRAVVSANKFESQMYSRSTTKALGSHNQNVCMIKNSCEQVIGPADQDVVLTREENAIFLDKSPHEITSPEMRVRDWISMPFLTIMSSMIRYMLQNPRERNISRQRVSCFHLWLPFVINAESNSVWRVEPYCTTVA